MSEQRTVDEERPGTGDDRPANEERLTALAGELETVVDLVMPRSMLMPMESPDPDEILAFGASDTDDPRTGEELLDAFIAQLRERGWEIDDSERDEPDLSVYAVHKGLGAGFFSCDNGTVGFSGFPVGSMLFGRHVLGTPEAAGAGQSPEPDLVAGAGPCGRSRTLWPEPGRAAPRRPRDARSPAAVIRSGVGCRDLLRLVSDRGVEER